jgi:Ca2+-binding EF-hand superfamily protein
MKTHSIKFLAATAALVGFSLVSFAAEAAKAEAKEAAKPSRAFSKADKNGDGKISEEEYVAMAGGRTDAAKAKTAFGRRDKNKDGFLTPDEFKTAEAAKKDGSDATAEKRDRRNKPAK